MGTVFAAADPRLGRQVALKLLHDGATTQQRRLRHEAYAMARLEHPNVVTIHDVGEHAGQLFVAMELVEGTDLRRWLRDAPREPEQILRAFLAAGRGLAAAHRAGVAHRDFKPSNVLVADDGRILVIDFGLAWLDTNVEVVSGDLETLRDSVSLELTQQGKIVGTPAFMAPEQWDARPARAAADQFAFCVALYQALMGVHPFGLGSDLCLRVVEHRLQPASPPSALAARLRPLLLRGLRPEPARRWSSMDELLDALARASVGRSSGWRWGLGSLAVLGTLCLLMASAWGTPKRCSSPPVDELWNPQLQASIHAHFVAVEGPLAEEQWTSVARQADQFVDQWRRDYQMICEMAPATMLDAHMACLRRGRARLDAAAKALGEADAGVIRRALEVLPHPLDLQGCEIDRVPEELGTSDLHDDLARVLVLERAGRYEDALTAVTEVTDLMWELDAPDLHARARLIRGSVLERLGHYDAALAELRAAFSLATEAGSDLRAMIAARQLGSVMGLRLEAYDDALGWLRHAAALAQRAGAQDVDRAEIERMFGSVALARGELADAQRYYERALERFERSEFELRDRGIAVTLTDLGRVTHAQGDHELALSYFERVYARYAVLLPESHPGRVSLGENVGVALLMLGHHREGERWLRRALALSREVSGPRHPSTAKIHNSLGAALARQGLDVESLGHYRRSLELTGDWLGDSHPQTAMAYANVGTTLLRLDRPAEGIEMLRKALVAFEEHLDPNHPNIGQVLAYLGQGWLTLGRPDDALPLLERSVMIRRRSNTDPEHLADTESLYLHVRSLASAELVSAP